MRCQHRSGDGHRDPASGALHRLATYGNLAPGRPNHRQLDGLDVDAFIYVLGAEDKG
jgi:hypothetical protein